MRECGGCKAAYDDGYQEGLAALERYTHHDTRCEIALYDGCYRRPNEVCICGLDAALATENPAVGSADCSKEPDRG